MRWFWMGGLLVVLAWPQSITAQVVFGPTGGAVVNRNGFSLGYHSKRFNISASFGHTSVYNYGLIGPPVFGSWYGYASPWIAPPVYYGPSPYFYGANPFFLPPQPLVISLPPIIVQQPIILPVRFEEPVEPPKVANPERFIVIQPDRGNNVARNPNPPPPARVDKEPKEVDLGVQPADLPLAPRRAGNALAEADRRLVEGRAAFARGEYGRALDHFCGATTAAPAESTGYFLLAQAQFAVGKFDEAVASIAAGMELQLDWPTSRFEPRALYKQNAQAFDFHLRNLRAALEIAPNDARLLFLLGVELWFDGNQQMARPLLERAAELARDPAPIWLFLRK